MRFREVNILKSNITSSLDVRTSYDKFGVVTRQLAKDSSKFVHRLQIYDFQKMQKLSSLDIYQTYSEQTHFIKFISDKNILAVATKFQIRFYQIQPLQLKKVFLHQQANVYDLQTSHDGQLVVLVGLQIRVWRTNGFRPAVFPHVIASARYCSFSKDNKYMAISSSNQINIYTFTREGGQFQFIPLNAIQSPPQSQDITSLQFNPTNSNQLVVGFINVSPSFFRIDTGFFVPAKDIQPLASKNAKIARYMPDGKRFLSFDFLKGVGLWPGTGQKLFYKQGYLLFDLYPNSLGTQFVGRVWQQIKFVQIQVQCKPETFLPECQCTAQYSWDYASYSCQPLSCLQKQNSTGQKKNNQCVCYKGYAYNKVLRKCMIECSTVDHAITISPNTGQCYCKDNYIWDPFNKQCQFNCKSIPYSTGIMISSEKCQCSKGFIWNLQYKECVCPQYSKPAGQTCVCYDQYFEDQSGKCIIDCNQILKTNGSAPSKQQCICQDGYYFTQYSSQVGCKLNCTNFSNTHYLSSGFDSCICIQNMNWVVNKCKINCGAIGYASGLSTTNENQCNCAVNYLWIDQIHQCGKNCSGIGFVNLDKKSTLRSCPCINNFNWDQTKQRCQIDCTTINNTNKYSLASPSQCQCRDAFNWVKDRFACEIDCTKIWDANQKLNDYTCSCSKDKLFNGTMFTCNAAEQKSFFSNPWVIVGFVVSIIVFVLIMIVLVKYCWQFKTKNNKEHQKKLKTNDVGQKPKRRKVKKDKQTEGLVSDDRLKTKTTL